MEDIIYSTVKMVKNLADPSKYFYAVTVALHLRAASKKWITY